MRRLLMMAFMALVLFTLVACGGNDTPRQETQEPSTAQNANQQTAYTQTAEQIDTSENEPVAAMNNDFDLWFDLNGILLELGVPLSDFLTYFNVTSSGARHMDAMIEPGEIFPSEGSSPGSTTGALTLSKIDDRLGGQTAFFVNVRLTNTTSEPISASEGTVVFISMSPYLHPEAEIVLPFDITLADRVVTTREDIIAVLGEPSRSLGSNMWYELPQGTVNFNIRRDRLHAVAFSITQP